MFDDNDEHFIALSNLMSQRIDLQVPQLDLSSSVLASGNSSARSASRNLSPAGGSVGSAGRIGGEPSPKEHVHENLYKTELCRTWEASHACQYGMKCRFAHGSSELRPVSRHPKYKTQPCKTFREQGHCPYGPRCLFIHEDPLDTSPSPGTGSGPPSGPPSGPVSPSSLAHQLNSLALRGDSGDVPGRIREPSAPNSRKTSRGAGTFTGGSGSRSHGSASPLSAGSRQGSGGNLSGLLVGAVPFQPSGLASAPPVAETSYLLARSASSDSMYVPPEDSRSSTASNNSDDGGKRGRRLQFFEVISPEVASAETTGETGE